MEYKARYIIEVTFTKNRHYPEYGKNAFCPENHSVFIPYGKRYDFKSSKAAINFIMDRLDDKVLDHYDSVGYTVWRGYSGLYTTLKANDFKSGDNNGVDKEFADSVLSY